ncbi:putative diheme cytochrome c-553 [Candidatus Burkholderia brachyanthoides]|nr:putative diheme cytochrome c-553 [Candidatus Burkholderia brachyanthoides]
MPYTSFSKIDDEDMHALYAYFMHDVEPIAEAALRTQLRFPYDQCWAMAFWNMAFAPTGRFMPDPKRDAQWNRGTYLVQSLGHCGACHTPRRPAYNETTYTLTSLEGAGLARLSAQDITSLLKTGHGEGLIPFGSMVEVVENNTQFLTDQDLLAIATYLKSLPPKGRGGAFDPNVAATPRGVALNTGDRGDGAGVAMKYPRLASNPGVLVAEPDSLIRLLLQGGHAPSTVYGPLPKEMPAFGKKLTDAEIVNVLSYVRSAWGNDAPLVTTREVRAVRNAVGAR